MNERSVPESELEVLACLDRQGAATARELRGAMAGYRPMAHGSMVTLLKRLEGRGLVSRRKAPTGKAFVYRPTAEASATYRRVLDRLRERIFGGDPVALVASLFEGSPPDRAEIEQLQSLLDRLREESDS